MRSRFWKEILISVRSNRSANIRSLEMQNYFSVAPEVRRVSSCRAVLNCGNPSSASKAAKAPTFGSVYCWRKSRTALSSSGNLTKSSSRIRSWRYWDIRSRSTSITAPSPWPDTR